MTNTSRSELVAAAIKSRLPAIYWQPEFAAAGGLITYSARLEELARRAASYVDRILKGANPADLPVELPDKFDLVINLTTAKQIGLKIPVEVLTRADRASSRPPRKGRIVFLGGGEVAQSRPITINDGRISITVASIGHLAGAAPVRARPR